MSILLGGLLGSSRNKVGSIVTYRNKGQDVARSLAPSVRNPRTAAQMTQRVKLANLVSLYRINSAWMDGLAFSTKPQTWSDYNAFVSANIGENRVYLTKQQAAAGVCIVSPVTISRGSLPTIEVNATSASVWQTNIGLGSSFSFTTDTTIGQLSTAIIENNNGLVQGMQLSLIMDYQLQQGGSYYAMVRYYEIVLDPNNTELLSSRMDVEHLGVSNDSLAYTRGGNDPIVGFAFILSHTIGNYTRVSTQRLTLTSSDVYNLFVTNEAQTNAIESYGASLEDPFLVSNYGESFINPAVDVQPSIVSAFLNQGSAVEVGEYLGAVNGEGEFSITLQLSSTPEDTPTAMTCGSGNSSVSASSVSIGESGISGSFAGVQWNPASPIEVVTLTLANGVILRATFRDQVSGGDVTE